MRTLKEHLDQILGTKFFDAIEVNNNRTTPDDIEINIPELPNGYIISYMRRSVRTAYRFAGSNTLRTSEEKVFVQMEQLYGRQTDVVDVFIENENVGELLEEDEWQPEEVAAEMESVLKFSDVMLQYLS